MGHCCDKNKIHAIDSLNDIPLNTTKLGEHYHAMISYAWADKSVCYRLADCLLRDKFRVWFRPHPIENKSDSVAFKAIDHSDFIVLCVSATYSQTYHCQREARYASDIHKRTIMVQVAPDYKMNDWLSFVKPGKVQFQLSGGKVKFETAYKQIVQELRLVTNSYSYLSYRSWEMSTPSNIPPEKDRPQASDSLFRKQIERHGCFITAIAESDYAWKTIDGFIGSAVRTDEEMKRRSQLDSDLTIMVKRRQQLSSYFNADNPNHFCLFAERIRQNMLDWQAFCEK